MLPMALPKTFPSWSKWMTTSVSGARHDSLRHPGG
jgi:hypothetical protein